MALSTGCKLLCYATHSCRENRRPQLVVKGTKGTLTWLHEHHYEIKWESGSCERHEIPGNFETKITMADAVIARLQGETAHICTTKIAYEHLRLVEALHAAAPIVDIPAQYLEQRDFVTSRWMELREIEAAIDQAAEKGSLWSKMKLPWSHPACAYEPAGENLPVGEKKSLTRSALVP